MTDAAFAGNVIVGQVVMRFVAVRAFEGAGVYAGNDRVRALAGTSSRRLMANRSRQVLHSTSQTKGIVWPR